MGTVSTSIENMPRSASNPRPETAGVTKPAALNPRTRRPRQDASWSGAEYADLVRAASAGDRDAMEALLMRAQEVAYRFSVTVCGHTDDAEDVMQEALIKTYRHAARIREPGAFRPWLYRTVRNACLMRRRLRVDEPRHLVSLDELLPGPDGPRPIDAPSAAKNPEEIAVNTRLRRRLRKALRALPASHRMVVFLREMEGLSTREVAGVMGVSEANVKTRLHRARLFLQKQLGDE